MLLDTLGHCATTSGKKNSLGAVIYEANPYIYVAGALADGPDAVSIVEGNLNLRINPLGTYMLYDESLLFCGTPSDMFRDVKQPFVLTYERQSHQRINGVGCHNLIRVDSLIRKKL